jgi:uncharacterized membrane protein
VEGMFYIISKYLKDPSKKRRFGTPIGVGILAISLTFLISNFILYEEVKDFIVHSTSIIIMMILGVLVLCYAFSVWTKLDEFLIRLRGN